MLLELNGQTQVDGLFCPRKEENVLDEARNKDNFVSLAQRKRSSLLDNRRMLYAFSSKHRVLHDRDCPRVRGISDEHFRMTGEFIKGMCLCVECQNRVYIRYGIGDDWRRIADYERFFHRMGLSSQDLFFLFIGNNAQVKWIDVNTLEVRVRHDTWRVVQRGERVELWHNNYWRLENSERSMERKFHLQSACALRQAWTLFRDICTYSYEKHCDAELFAVDGFSAD